MRFWQGLGVDTWRRYNTLLLLIFIASYALSPSAKWSNNIFYALILLPVCVHLIKFRGANVLRNNPVIWGWLALLAWFFVPAFIDGGLDNFKPMVYVFIFVLTTACFVNQQFLRSALFVRGLFWFICSYILATTLVYLAIGRYALGDHMDVLPGRIENTIYTSMWLVGALALAAPTWLRESRWIEAGAGLLASLFCVGFVLQSRTGLVGLVFLGGLAGLYLLKRFPLKAGVAAAALLVLALGAGWLLKEQPWFISLWAKGDGFRFEILHHVIGDWQACGWWLGCGPSYVSHAVLSNGTALLHPHNMYVSMGVYSGLAALLLFVSLMLCTLVLAYRRRDPWGLYLVVTLLMLNFDGAKLIRSPDQLWLLVLLPAGLIAGYAFPYSRYGQSAAGNISPSL